jgi:hypothetical protein
MVNAFGILTAIVLALASFVAYKNKGAYETEITNTNTEKAGLKKSQERLALAKSNLADTIAKRNETDDENVKLGEQETAQNKTNEDLKSQIATKTAKIAENKAKLDDIRDRTSKVGDINALASKMKALNAELEELNQNIASNEAKLANISSENTQAEAHVKALKDKFETISQNRSLPALKTHIRSVYPAWGFVTLASGNDAGVVTGSTLDVMRDDTLVAKLLVTAVERNSASASIIPDSMAQEAVLMVGDRVVPGQKATAQPAQN